jgi:hypothetical protein
MEVQWILRIAVKTNHLIIEENKNTKISIQETILKSMIFDAHLEMIC